MTLFVLLALGAVLAVALYLSGRKSDAAGRGMAEGMGVLYGLVVAVGLGAACVPWTPAQVLAWLVAVAPFGFAALAGGRQLVHAVGRKWRARPAAFFATAPELALAKAILADDPAKVAACARTLPSLDPVGAKGLTPLLYALRNRKLAAARALLTLGANPNAAGCDGGTPMTEPAVADPALLEVLLSHGGNPAAVDASGEPLAFLCVRSDHVALLRTLLVHGLSPRITGRDGEALTEFAARLDRKLCLDELRRDARA